MVHAVGEDKFPPRTAYNGISTLIKATATRTT